MPKLGAMIPKVNDTSRVHSHNLDQQTQVHAAIQSDRL